MPLIKSPSKKAFQKNVEAEMKAHPGAENRAQNLAIAYSVKRKAARKKKASGGSVESGSSTMNFAEGGVISAAKEKRPSTEQTANDSASVRRNDNMHPPAKGDTMQQDDISYQAKKGMRTTPIKHPKMVPSTGFSAKLRDQEDDLMSSAGPNDGPQRQPPSEYDEESPKRQGPPMNQQDGRHVASNIEVQKHHGDRMLQEIARTKMAAGGGIDEVIPDTGFGKIIIMKAEGGDITAVEESRPDIEDEFNDSAEISRNDEMHAQDLVHQEHPMDDMDQFEEQPEDEAELDHAASVAAAIMSKRKMMAEGGRVASDEINGHDSIYSDDSDQADLSRNAEEDANEEDQLSFNALTKENYSESEGLAQLDQPEDSNESGHELDDERDKSVVDAIRRKMKTRSPITR